MKRPAASRFLERAMLSASGTSSPRLLASGRTLLFSPALVGILLFLLSGVPFRLRAQEQSPDGAFHMKVYADLAQLQVLVMNENEDSYGGLKAGDFRIQLDSGPPFTPKNSRLEGNDQLTVALVFDESGEAVPSLRPYFWGRTNWMPGKFLNKEDTLVPYVFQCNLVQGAPITPYGQKAALRAFDRLLNSPSLDTTTNGAPCEHHVALWDSLAQVGKQISDLPGRHVIFVVTDGVDRGSHFSWEQVRVYLSSRGVTVFAIRPFPDCSVPAIGDASSCAEKLKVMQGEDTLSLFIGGTGGLTENTNMTQIGVLLQRLALLTRNRYILDFNSPRGKPGGSHTVDVSLPGRKARIRTSGVTVPIRRVGNAANPDETPHDSETDPVIGDRRPLPPQP